MTLLILGLVIFLGVHAFTTLRPQRDALVGRFGENGYKGLYSLASLVGFVLIIKGFGDYRSTAWVQLWTPPTAMKHVAALLMWPAFILLVAAYSPGLIRSKAKHPMLAGVKLWAFAHLLANGDLGGVILFGAFLAWAVYDRISLKKRGVAPKPMPFGRGDVIAIGVGTALYLAMAFKLHSVLIGVPVFG
jgi:uncharacterized membrane protein